MLLPVEDSYVDITRTWGQKGIPRGAGYDDAMSAGKDSMARRYLVSGRVQGVGFRYFVEREAQRLGVAGFTRNLDDGRVEVQAQGTASQLADLEGALWNGPRMADVRGVEAAEIAMGDWIGFRIR